MYTQNEILFPHYAIQSLRDARGPEWQSLIDHVVAQPETSEVSLAFMMMMIRLNNCLECETDSYRAMRGCEACSAQTIRRHKSSDQGLVELYEQILAEVRAQIMPAGVDVVQKEAVS